MPRKRGGGFFTTTVPALLPGGVATTVVNWKNIIFLILGIIILGVIIGVSVWAGTRPKKDEKGTDGGGGAVGPKYSDLPGRITIAEVAQAPSSGQAIIYFSKAEAAGTTCDVCTAEFDINLTYTGGTPQQPPVYKMITAPSTSGVVTFDYSVFTPPPPTGAQNIQINTSPPTQVQIDITVRSITPQGRAGGSTTFSKTIPYV
jgi:hypothetical protein